IMIKMTNEQLYELIEKRRYLHQHPELAFEEFHTTEKIKEWLTLHDITILSLNMETGIIAEVKGVQDGPTIAIRADIDALPIQEEADVPFRSKHEGKMHACGHDFHTASIIGTAILLQEHKELLRG